MQFSVLCSGVSGISLSPSQNSCVVIKNCMLFRFSNELGHIEWGFYILIRNFKPFFIFSTFLFGQFIATDNSLAMEMLSKTSSSFLFFSGITFKRIFYSSDRKNVKRKKRKNFLFKYFKWNYFTSRS